MFVRPPGTRATGEFARRAVHILLEDVSGVGWIAESTPLGDLGEAFPPGIPALESLAHSPKFEFYAALPSSLEVNSSR